MRDKDGLLIRDERIILRSLNREDSERYRVLRNQEENRKCFFTNAIISEEDQQKWFERYYMDHDEYMFSIYERNSERYLGAVALYHIDAVNKRAEIGRIIVDRSVAAGKGYGRDAIRCMVEWGRENLGIKTFYAQIYKDNLPSTKAFLGCGFVEKECEASQWILVEKTVQENSECKNMISY